MSPPQSFGRGQPPPSRTHQAQQLREALSDGAAERESSQRGGRAARWGQGQQERPPTLPKKKTLPPPPHLPYPAALPGAMGHTTGPPHAAASPLPAVAPPLPGGAIPGDCPCPRRGLGLTRNPGPPQPAQDLPGSYSPECGRPERRGKGRGDKIPLVVARPRAQAACLQLGGGPLGRVTPIQQKRMKRVRGQRGRQPWAEPLLLCAAPSQTQERARLRARPHPEPRPLPAPGASAGAPGAGGLCPQRTGGLRQARDGLPALAAARRQRLATARLCLS